MLFTTLLATLALVLITSPFSTKSQSVVWKPKVHIDSGELLVTRGWPQEMKILVDTDLLQRYRGKILDFGDWSLSWSSVKGISVSKEEKVIASSLCRAKLSLCEITFEAANNQLQDNSDTTFKIERTDFPIISKLEIPSISPMSIQQVDLTLRPSQYSNGFRTILVCIILFLYLIFLARSSLTNRQNFKIPTPKFKALALLEFFIVFSTLSISSLLIPALPDDGWVMTRINLYQNRGYFGNYFTNLDAPMPQGFFTEYLMSILSKSFSSLLTFRFLAALLLTLSWVIIKRYILNRVWSLNRGQETFVLLIFLTSSISYLITIRSEFWIFIFSIGIYMALLGLSTEYQKWSFFAFFFFFVLSLLTHQTGVTLLAPLSVYLYFCIKKRFLSIQNLIYALHGSILAVTLSYSGISLASTIEGLEDFSMSSGYRNNEIFRWNQIFSFASSPRVMVVLLLYLFVFLTFLLYANQSRSISTDERVLITAATFAPFTLLLTSSKWIWHFGALTLPLIILGTYVISRVSKKPFEWLYFTFFASAVVSLLSFRYSNTWGYLDFGLVPTDSLKGLLDSGFFLLLSLAFVTFAGIIISRSRLKNDERIPIFLSFPISFVLIINLGMMGLELQKTTPKDYSLSRNWSPAIQNIDALFGRDNCGLLGHMRSVRLFAPLSEKVIRTGYSDMPSRAEFDVLDYETFEKITLPSNFISMGGAEAYEMKFHISRSKSLGMWIFQNSEVPESIQIRFLGSSGILLANKHLKSWQPGVWNWIPFKAPSAAQQLMIKRPIFEDPKSRLTKPGSYTSLAKSAQKENVEGLISPYVQPYFNCIKPVDPSKGILHGGRLLIPGLYFFSDTNYAQIGCWTKKSFCVYSREIDFVGELSSSQKAYD